jgi:hypothetical protein
MSSNFSGSLASFGQNSKLEIINWTKGNRAVGLFTPPAIDKFASFS